MNDFQEPIRVLVSGAGGDVAQGVIRALQISSLNIDVYKICVDYESSWLHIDEKSFKAPYSSDINYITYLIKLINKHKIDLFIPCVDSEIIKIAMNKNLIEEETNAKVFSDALDKLEICDDKYKTVEYLESIDLPHPRAVIPDSKQQLDGFIEKIGFPLIAKPRMSQGSKDLEILTTHESAYKYIGKSSFMLQEYIPSNNEEEYTCGIYLGDDNDVKSICILKRKLKNGSTYIAERILNADWEHALERIAINLGIKYLNIQFREMNGIIYPFEFNGRFSGTTGIISKIYNAPEFLVRERILNQKLQIEVNNELFHVMRYYDHIYSSTENMKALISRTEDNK